MTFVHSKSTRIVRAQPDSEEIARDTILGPGEHGRVHSNLYGASSVTSLADS